MRFHCLFLFLIFFQFRRKRSDLFICFFFFLRTSPFKSTWHLKNEAWPDSFSSSEMLQVRFCFSSLFQKRAVACTGSNLVFLLYLTFLHCLEKHNLILESTAARTCAFSHSLNKLLLRYAINKIYKTPDCQLVLSWSQLWICYRSKVLSPLSSSVQYVSREGKCIHIPEHPLR